MDLALHYDFRPTGAATLDRTVALQMHDLALSLSSLDVLILHNCVLATQRLSDNLQPAVDPAVAFSRARQEAAAAKREKMRQALGRLTREFRRIDADGSGLLDNEEIGKLIHSVYSSSDGGCVLTESELRAAATAFMDEVASGESVTFAEFRRALDPTRRALARTGMLNDITCQEYAVGGESLSSPIPDSDASEGTESGRSLWAAASSAMSPRGNTAGSRRRSAPRFADAVETTLLWRTYLDECGTTRRSLCGQNPRCVQQKLVRTVGSFARARDFYRRHIEPSLERPCPWVLGKTDLAGGRGTADILAAAASAAAVPGDGNRSTAAAVDAATTAVERLDAYRKARRAAGAIHADDDDTLVHTRTNVSTALGGVIVNCLDALFPAGRASLSLAVDRIGIALEVVERGRRSAIVAGADIPAGTTADPAAGPDMLRLHASFRAHGEFWNPHSEATEPFLEHFQPVVHVRVSGGNKLVHVAALDRLRINVAAACLNNAMRFVQSCRLSTGEIGGGSDEPIKHVEWDIKENRADVFCDVCGKPITGPVVWHCPVCASGFDVCGACYTSGFPHYRDHFPFAEEPNPVWNPVQDQPADVELVAAVLDNNAGNGVAAPAGGYLHDDEERRDNEFENFEDACQHFAFCRSLCLQ